MKTAYVLLAGGNSEMLFPISRENMPKQFKKYGKQNVHTELAEEKNVKSTFQETVSALKDYKLYVVTQEKYRFHTKTQLKELGVDAEIILQPDDGDIRDAIRLSFMRIDADRIIFFPTDQVILDKRTFLRELKEFEKLSEESQMSIILSKSVTPGPRFGYALPENPEEKYSRAKDYIEKPQNYISLSKNGYYPSTGIISIHEKLLEKFGPNDEYVDFIKKNLETVYISSYRWFEVNAITEIANFTIPDENNNAIIGNALPINTKNTIIYNETAAKIIAAGIENIEIIQVGDVTLVLNKEQIKNYREIIERIKKNDPDIFKNGQTVYKPWGRYTSLFKSKYFQIKILELYPGSRISLQKHYHRSEHWIVVNGTALARVGDREILLRPGESTFVPVGEIHQLSNPGKIPLKVVEVQYGEYLEEDDIVRLQDDYGRK